MRASSPRRAGVEGALHAREEALFVLGDVELEDRAELADGAVELDAVDRGLERALERDRDLRVPDAALDAPALFAQGRADGRVEDLRLDGHVRREVGGELRQERLAHACAPALDGLAELLKVAVMTLEKGGRFHDRGAAVSGGGRNYPLLRVHSACRGRRTVTGASRSRACHGAPVTLTRP